MGGSYKWPSIDKVAEFRGDVRRLMRRIIQQTPLELPVTPASPWVCITEITKSRK